MGHLLNCFFSRGHLHTILASVVILSILGGCEKQQDTPPPAATPVLPITVDDPALNAATQQVWQTASTIITAAMASVDELNSAVNTLLATPNADNLQAAQTAWQNSHNAYQLFALFIALGDSNPGLFGPLQDYNFAVDAYPIQPGFIDYFAEYSHSGIVNDIAMPLTADALREQHGVTDESDVSLGFHALEYLFWGEKGARPPADFSAIDQLTSEQLSAGLRVVDLPNNRRRTLLRLLVNLLTDDIASLQTAWANPGALLAQNYQRLPAQGRMQLLVSAAHAWVLSTIEEMQHFADPTAQTDTDGETDITEPADLHNPFAGSDAVALARQLDTLKSVLLSEDQGVGQWAISAADRNRLLSSVQNQLTVLSQAQDLTWPPADKTQQALTDMFIDLLDVLSQDISPEPTDTLGETPLP